MKNVTVSLPEDTAQWVRVWAAQQGKSVSAALAQLVEEKRRQGQARAESIRGFKSVQPVTLDSQARKYPSRDSLYGR